jgi:hypothetical protein
MPLLYNDQAEALEQRQTARSIRQKVKRQHLIIRVTDKSNNFYVGSAAAFQRKAQAFFSDTNAFVELSENPFNEILDSVIRLLNRLASKKLIFQWHCKQMMPDRTKCELAHLYFNPKTHKVKSTVAIILSTSLYWNRMAFQCDQSKAPFEHRQKASLNSSIASFDLYSMIDVMQQPLSTVLP